MAENNQFTSGQAPPVSAWALAPDIAGQQQSLMRRQAMAQFLLQQGMQPSGGTEVINGWAVKKSPAEGLSKLAEMLGGALLQRKNDSDNADLSKQYAQILNSQIEGGSTVPAQSSDQSAPQQTQGQDSASTQQAQQTSQQPSPMDLRSRMMKANAIGQVYGADAAKAFLADTARTDMEKQNNYLGIGSGQARSLELAKRMKEGTADFTPGHTSRLPDGSIFVAPNYDTGIAGGVDARGNPTSKVITGAPEAAAAMTSANEGAKSQFQLLPKDYVGVDGRPIGGTVGEYVNSGSQKTQQPLPVDNSKLSLPFLQSEASASQAANLPGGFLPAIRTIESNSTPGAVNKNTNGTIDRGAYQINSANKGLDGDNPEHAAQLAAAAMQKAKGDPRLAAIYYHGGLGTNPNSAENKRYADKFMSAYQPQQETQQQPAQPSGRPVLQSATEAAQAAADVQAKNQPRLAQNTETAKNMANYEQSLNDNLSKSQELMKRLSYTQDALNNFRTGGGKESRMALAKVAQGLGANQKLVDAVAGGDLGAAQTIENLAIQESIQNMKTALASDSGGGTQGNRVAMEHFIASNPSVTSDPRAFEKMVNLQKDINNTLLERSNNYFSYKKENQGDTSGFPNYWANRENSNGGAPSAITNNYPYNSQKNSQPVSPSSPSQQNQPMTAARWASMKSGDTFVDAQGNVRRKP